MGPKKGKRNVRKTGVPTETFPKSSILTEFEWGDTASDIQRRREEREQREREIDGGEGRKTTDEGEREG